MHFQTQLKREDVDVNLMCRRTSIPDHQIDDTFNPFPHLTSTTITPQMQARRDALLDELAQIPIGTNAMPIYLRVSEECARLGVCSDIELRRIAIKKIATSFLRPSGASH